MRRTASILILAAALGLTACIRDEIPPCPAMAVKVAVQDKNYFNAGEVKEVAPVAEDLPFREYVGTVYYRVSDPADGSTVEEKGPIAVTTDEGEFTLPLCPCIPHGTYDITVWGGLQTCERLAEGAAKLHMHKDGKEGEDVYVAHGTVKYDAYSGVQVLLLERVKGLLLVLAEGLPAGQTDMEARIDGLSAEVSRELEYGQSCGCTFLRQWQEGTAGMARVILAPTPEGAKSRAEVTFRNAAGGTYRPAGVDLAMKRNTITVIKYHYDPTGGGFSIYLLVDGTWQLYHDMIVD